MPHCKTVNWGLVNQKITNQPWAKALYLTLKEDFDAHVAAWPHSPTPDQSEWGHTYFCAECGVKLTFAFATPHEHTCPHCGRVFSGYPYDGAWCKILHSTIVDNMERAAILAHAPSADARYATYIHDTILFYAENYHKYPQHGAHAGIGKIYPQSLSEAIFIIAIERILRLTADLCSVFTADEYARIGELFFKPGMELIRPQITIIHNIHMWMQSAVAACANVLNLPDVLHDAIYGELGWLNQLKKGVTPEGIWYEVSNTYHYYTLAALNATAQIALENDINLFDVPEYAKMASSYPQLSFPDGLWPAYNDGWFGGKLYDSHAVYEELSATNPAYAALLAWMYDRAEPAAYMTLNSLFSAPLSPTGFARSSLAALLYGPLDLPAPESLARDSFLYERTGIAVMQNKNLRVTLKCTGDGGGHDHNDKNAIELYAHDELLSCDPGTTGYALPFTFKWSRTTLAHNTVCINGARQLNCAPDSGAFDGESVSFVCSKAYEGAILARTISLKERGFDDRFTVTCDAIRCIDWCFHCAGQAAASLPLTPAPNFAESNGYDQLFDLSTATTDDGFTISFETERQTLHMTFDAAPGTQIFLGKCYGSDMTRVLSFLMLRREAAETEFVHSSEICLKECAK